jgi:hypothetical protein
VVVSLDGISPEFSSPVGIHEGTCTNLDPNPTYPLTPVIGLGVGLGGELETIIDVSLTQLMSQPHAINIQETVTEPNNIACGEIPTTGEPGTPDVTDNSAPEAEA